jgi:hypothetical protein
MAAGQASRDGALFGDEVGFKQGRAELDEL